MEREKVNICDDCKDTVAKYKCKFCNQDLCEGCMNVLKFDGFRNINATNLFENRKLNKDGSGYESTAHMNFVTICCNNCFKRMQNLKLEDTEQYRQIKEEFCKYLQKILLVDSMDEKEKEDPLPTSFIPTMWPASTNPKGGSWRSYTSPSSLSKKQRNKIQYTSLPKSIKKVKAFNSPFKRRLTGR